MNEPDNEQDKWEEILLGKSIPDTNDPIEKKARNVRQIILWKSAEQEKDLVSSRQAHIFYRKTLRLKKKREKFRYLITGLLIFSIVLLIFSFTSPFSDKAHKNTKINPQNFLTKNTINDMPYMLEIPSGTFTMGCENGWDDTLGSCRSNEKPPHEVTVKKFALSKYEITIEQFSKFVAETGYKTVAEVDEVGCTIRGKDIQWILSKENNWKNPGFDQNDQHPVVCISWDDTQAYIEWISRKTEKKYRLPTEEEWEYSARSGEITAFHWGGVADHNSANYRGTGGRDKWINTSPVGSFSGNNFGLHAMSGNVWEWVESCWRPNYENDCPNENQKVRRGGSWIDPPQNIRSAYRSHNDKNDRSFLYGFRVAHDLK